MKMNRIKLGLAAVGGVGLLLTACIFTGTVGVGDLVQPRVVGMLSLNEEGSRAYVGLRTSGSEWNAIARVASLDVTTGAELGTTPAWSSGSTFRAVTTDPSNDHVWTLHDDGSIVEWPLDLGSYTSYTNNFFEAPPGGHALEMFCDFEILPSGHSVATGIASNGSQYIGFYSYVYPHPAFPGQYDKTWTYWDIDENSELIRSCPRVATDNSTEEVVFLIPDRSFTSGADGVWREELYSWDGGGGNIYWGLSDVSSWTLPTNPKFLPDDLSSELGKTVVQSEYLNLWGATSHGSLALYDTASASLEDTTGLYESRAIDMVDHIVDSNYPSGVLWWVGHDKNSGKEIGFITLAN
jgi:hypothetical protein